MGPGESRLQLEGVHICSAPSQSRPVNIGPGLPDAPAIGRSLKPSMLRTFYLSLFELATNFICCFNYRLANWFTGCSLHLVAFLEQLSA